MKVFGIAGWSGSGKTTLLVRLIPELTRRGLTVSTCKHAHHNFDVDTPGKDSYEHRVAGARQVMIVSGKRWALMHELRDEPEPDFDQALKQMAEVDLVLVEGFKKHPHDKLEVHRKDNGSACLWPDDPHVVAVASDVPLPDLDRPRLDVNNIAAIADFIVAHCHLKPD
ncbi:MAG: molybdopterin-guanine dinucleotide biosynthesis protein B [Alphaproteobacteria bacterium]